MSLRVLIDTTPLMRKNLTGIGVYVKNLIERLRAHDDVRVTGAWKWSRFGKRADIARHIAHGGGPYLPLISDLNLRGYDIYHGPDFRIPTTRRYRKVVTVHDLVIHEPTLIDPLFAEQGRAKLDRMIREGRPDAIITVSHFTRDRLLEHYPRLESITHVVYLGIDHERTTASDRPLDMPWGSAPFMLYVGSVELRKNLRGIIEAFEIARATHDVRLVIVGGNGHGAEAIDAQIAGSPQRHEIHRLGFVDDATLAALYRDATLFIYPSLYEGFGLPILESMAAGCPVITSDRGAMAEVAGDAALLVDPYDSAAIATAMIELLDDESMRARLTAAGRERARGFSWNRCAAETVEVYRAVM